MREVFIELSEISKESDWWSEMSSCFDNFKACHVKSAAVTEFTVICT